MKSSSLTAARGSPSGSWALSIALRLERDGAEVVREPVGPDDLSDAISEAWLEAMLRKGRPDLVLEDFEARIEPVWSQESGSCTGYVLESLDGQGNASRRPYSVYSLEPVAGRAAQRLIAQGILQPPHTYYYQIVPEQSTSDSVAASGLHQSGMRTRPLAPLEIEMGPLLQRATPIGLALEHERPFEVFYTEAAVADAERCARLGERQYPPVETGGVLVGFLCACPVSGEFFAVVVEVLQAQDADAGQFSLAYSSQTWARIQAVMDARQQHRETHGMRILGQCHGHNFIPGAGAPPCEVCDRVAVCTRSSVFVSTDDWNWNRAVFCRQPWQLCHIFGLNARREQVQGLFGLRDGRLLERGYHVLPDFYLEEYR